MPILRELKISVLAAAGAAFFFFFFSILILWQILNIWGKLIPEL